MNPWNSNYKSHQGNIGLGQAIAYFTSIGVPVLLPLNDTQKYDLVVDLDGLKRISIKTTKQLNKNHTHFVVGLRNTGGSSGKSIIRKFNNKDCDYVFVYTYSNRRYLIPSEEIDVNTITLNSQWDKYLV